MEFADRWPGEAAGAARYGGATGYLAGDRPIAPSAGPLAKAALAAESEPIAGSWRDVPVVPVVAVCSRRRGRAGANCARMAGSHAARRVFSVRIPVNGGSVVKLTLRDKESAQEAVRRFRKLVERSGIKKEMRVREFYEKPSETKRRARLRAQRRARRDRFMATH
jgi:small subunit ribosomal protein S21